MLNGMSAMIEEKIVDQYSKWTLIQTLLSNLTAFINEGDRCTIKEEHVIHLTWDENMHQEKKNPLW